MKPSKVVQEHKGLAKVHAVCAEMDAVWRPTAGSDLGIDGQVEFLEPGTAISTGHIIAVQVKSGASYFRSQDERYIRYYVSNRHRRYWERLNLPVVLVLHDPDTNLTFYARVKPQLHQKGPILVPKNRILEPSARLDLLGVAKEDARQVPPAEILKSIKVATLGVSGDQQISGIEFLLACTDPARGYFELRMCRILALLRLTSEEAGVSIGSDTYDFILRCVMKFWAARLTEPFEEDFEETWYGLYMVPDIAVPLTSVGLDVLGHLWSHLDEYVSVGPFSHLGCPDATSLAKIIAEQAQHESDRLDASDRMGEVTR